MIAAVVPAIALHAFAAVGAAVVLLALGLTYVPKIARMLQLNLPRVLPITVCPACRRWSPSWCNHVDWWGDGRDCAKKNFVRVNRDGSLRRTLK